MSAPVTREERERWSMWNADHVERSEAQRVSEADICRLLAALDAADALAARAEGLIYAAERAALHNAADNAEWFTAEAAEGNAALAAYRALVEPRK